MKKMFTILTIVILTCLVLFSELFFFVGIATSMTDMAIFGGISGAILLIPDIILIKKVSEYKKTIKQDRIDMPLQETKVVQKQRSTSKSSVNTGRGKFFHYVKYRFTHVLGLPVMEGAICSVRSEYDKITIKTQGTVLTLNKNRITYIGKENNIQKYAQAVSSVGGAIAGSMLFGGIGAALGGRVKSRNFLSKRQYLVIAYIGEDDVVKYIVFDYIPQAIMLIIDFKLFNKANPQKLNIEIK